MIELHFICMDFILTMENWNWI